MVRLAIDKLAFGLESDTGRDTLRSWAFLLRSSTHPGRSINADITTLDLTPSEAVVPDRFLRRLSESDIISIEHASESQCLWNVEFLLERNGDRPGWPSIETARRELAPDD